MKTAIKPHDEFLRTKNGNANSFNVEAPNILKWDLRVDHEDVFNYFKSAIALRRAHRAFRLASWEEVNANVRNSIPRGDVLVNDITPVGSETSWRRVLVIYNSGNNF